MSNVQALLKSIKIGGVEVKNRVILPSMAMNFANYDGTPTRTLLSYYAERAKGGCGLIITEAMPVLHPYETNLDRPLAINSYQKVQEWHDVIDTVHSFGTKILGQIYHSGLLTKPYARYYGDQNVSAGEFAGAREITKDEIKEVIDAFVNSATIAYKTGFDGVEIHGAHMYLPNQFLSPLSNQRADEYGGSLENRFRFLKEILTGIREVCPRPFILSVRLAMVDLIPGGITLEEGAQYAKWCEDAGADLINTSCGFYTKMYEGAETQWEPQGARLYMAEAAKKAVSIPVAAVGKLRDPEFCADLIDNERIDMVCIGRPQICDPQWTNKIRFGKIDQIRPCLNCLQCMNTFGLEASSPVRCSINPYVGFEDRIIESSVNAVGSPKKLVVIGGGLSGMQFAIIAKRRGHDVSIIEKTDKLGGQMILGGELPFKKDVVSALNWYRDELGRLDIDIQYNTLATIDTIKSMKPDAVVIAVGSLPSTPKIKGIENAIESWKILDKTIETPEEKKVVIIGGGVVGSELAHKLVENGCNVTILEMLPEICHGHDIFHKDKLETYLNENADVKLNVRVDEVLSNKVVYFDSENIEMTTDCDLVIYSTGQHSIGNDLYNALVDEKIEAYKIGDCDKPGKFLSSTRSACDLAYRI
ncbi:MAG: FAD-dependent oxidoreductase [Saccharofermentanales bacterium]|jgi:2,4-dienoyl-CoA reductase-like NADH-dependent reductase (Old Yellow Enzyme family)/thioredoxin reductase